MNHNTRIPELLTTGALCLMLVIVPLIYVKDIYEYSLLPKLLALYLCLGLAAFGWLAQTGWGRRFTFASNPLNLPLFCYTGIACLSLFQTTHLLDALVELSYQFALTGLFLLAAHALPFKRLPPLLWANTCTGLVIASIGILQYHNLFFQDIPTNGHPSATFGYRNFASMYLVCALPLAGLHFLTARNTAGRILSSMAAALMGVFLIYTRTRGAWVGLTGALLATGALLLFHPGLRTNFFQALRPLLTGKRIVLPAVFLAVFVILAALPARFTDTGLQRFDEKKADVASTVFSIATGKTDRGRLTMWNRTLELILDHPVLGVGPGGWKRIYPAYDRGAMIRPSSSPRRPHNDYLWIAAEYGLPGLLCYLWLLVTAFYCLFSLARRPDAFWRIAAPAIAVALLATLGHALFSFPRERPQAMMFQYLLLGLIAGATTHRKVHFVPRIAGLACPALLLALLGGSLELTRRQINFDHHYLHAILGQDQEDWPEILSQANGAMNYGIFRPHALVIRGRALEKSQEYDQAKAAYQQALAYEPHNWYAYNGLGVLFKREGNYATAQQAYRKALEIDPNSIVIRNNLGALYKNMGDLTGAEQEFRFVLASNPSDVGANNNLGNIFKTRNLLDSAMVYYQKALETDPGVAQAHNNLADLYRRQNQFPKAIEHYRIAARLKPGEPLVFWGLGLTLEASGDVEGAETAFRQAIAFDPNYPNPYYNLATIYDKSGRYALAAETYQAFLDRWPGDEAIESFARERLAECLDKAKK
ncbi:MAG: tetratricopeptide repeat protein [bacterium]|nr:tetratricopeptide repeat protein [bacterium]